MFCFFFQWESFSCWICTEQCPFIIDTVYLSEKLISMSSFLKNLAWKVSRYLEWRLTSRPIWYMMLWRFSILKSQFNRILFSYFLLIWYIQKSVWNIFGNTFKELFLDKQLIVRLFALNKNRTKFVPSFNTKW